MRNKFLIIGAGILSISFLGVANARPGASVGLGVGAGANVSAMNTHAGLNANTRATVRGPSFTPRGWSHGRKTGWHGRSRPPGLR